MRIVSPTPRIPPSFIRKIAFFLVANRHHSSQIDTSPVIQGQIDTYQTPIFDQPLSDWPEREDLLLGRRFVTDPPIVDGETGKHLLASSIGDGIRLDPIII